MAIVAADWSVSRTTKNIRYIGDDHGGASPSYATVIELHRWLQDLADDAISANDDELAIIDINPSSRSTDNIITLINGYNIDDISSEHLYDGSIVQSGGDVIYDGIVNFGNSTVQIQIIQNGAVLADDWWNFSGGGLNADAAQGVSHRFMLKVRTAAADIDGRRIIGITRQFGFTYGEFGINGTSRGNNVLALSNSNDLNNETVEGTVATWTTITNVTQGYVLLDVDNNGSDEAYYSEWNKDSFSINQFFERMKWLTRDGSVSTLYGLNGELFRGITHEINISTGTGTWGTPEFEQVTWTGGTGQLLAVDNKTGTASTKMWIQLLTGNSPTNAQVITGATSTATATASGTSIDRRPVSIPFVGQSTGSAIIGAYGIGIETTDLSATDTLFDLTNTPITPPNNVTFTVAGLVSGEDRVLVAPWDGTTTDPSGNPAIDEDQLSLNTTLNTDNITSVVVSTAIPSDTPATGFIRVEDNNGLYRRLAYSSWTGSTFTITTTDGNEDFLAVPATAANNVYIAYIDVLASSTTAAFTAVYLSNRNLVVLVRDGGVSPIKEFISSAVFGANNTTITAIRTSDE